MEHTKGRKTIAVSEILDTLERMARHLVVDHPDATLAQIDLLHTIAETVLFSTNNYRGFREDGLVHHYYRNERTK